MTAPAPKTIEREKDKLWLTDAELQRRLGVPMPQFRVLIQQLDTKRSGFPQKQKIWGDRRYWPAVKAYLDRTYGLNIGPSAHGRTDQ